MPILVHLADKNDSKKILKAGIKLGKFSRGIYCMPVTQNFLVSHQWLRELKRSGVRNIVGVYFRLNSAEKVWAAHYNQVHKEITIGTAIKHLLQLADPLGYEIIITRKIEVAEILYIRDLPQVLGWRYKPHSHETRPCCTCPVCIPAGSIKGKKLRKILEQEKLKE